ncbi:MAG: hypothetical protein ACQEQT_00945 [Chloroflexota bacterium]
MVFRILAIARDCSILLLGIEIFVVLLLPILALWYTTRWLKSFMPQMIHTLEDVKEEWFHLVSQIDSVLARIRAPVIWIASKGEGLRVFLSRLRST